MISSIVISQLIDESRPEERGAALPAPYADARPPAWPGKPSLASGGRVTVHRAFAFLPGQLGIQAPLAAQTPDPELPPKEEKACSSVQRGFASITITARRVSPRASTLAWAAAGDPLCVQCKAQAPPLRDASALVGGAYPCGHHGPLTCAESSRNSSVMRLKFPEAPSQLRDGHQSWVADVDHGEKGFPPGAPRSGRGPLLFSSCVHLRVSPRCPRAACYLDRGLSVPAQQAHLARPKLHRSVLSLSLSCSSHRLTPDGADGTANGGPLGGALEQRLSAGTPGLLGPCWTPAAHRSLGQVRLRAGACPWSGSPPVDNPEFAGGGTRQVTVRKGKEEHATHCHRSLHANQLSIHIPGWSYRAGDYTCCDLVVKIEDCKMREAPAMPEPAPAPPEQPGGPSLQEDASERQQKPARASLTLQEALEVRKPQFISRSQERLRRLELMAQQRRAQRKEGTAPRPGPGPGRSGKRQFTVPHPLSDNLFRPKERYISEKEMHLRSKRIYNNLPEVKKKKEEQKKRVLLQSNRLRAEVFKKQLLDQLLQRNAV